LRLGIVYPSFFCPYFAPGCSKKQGQLFSRFFQDVSIFFNFFHREVNFMQCAYINFLIKKNHVPAIKLEEACHMSASTISRIKSGKHEVPDEEFALLVTAAGGDMKSYHAFCDALNASPNVITSQDALTLSDLRQIHAAEIDRINAAHEKEIQLLERVHDRELARLEALIEKLVK
jgi:transcriptional regulator with XRE-family HTH domain